jgi:catechol 2,3-dioxygenase-like lactoylglutathione lyase family enzyme
MEHTVDHLLRRYESGQVSRRQFLVAVTALASAPAAVAAATSPIGKVEQLNHATLFVRDVQKSVLFYQDVLGLQVLTQQGAGINLRAGTGFVGLYPAPAASAPVIDHVCLGMPGFDADAVLQQLTQRGVPASIRMRGETKELYCNDPDNLRVQLQDVSYKGGTGVLGNRDP